MAKYAARALTQEDEETIRQQYKDGYSVYAIYKQWNMGANRVIAILGSLFDAARRTHTIRKPIFNKINKINKIATQPIRPLTEFINTADIGKEITIVEGRRTILQGKVIQITDYLIVVEKENGFKESIHRNALNCSNTKILLERVG
jgi:hypothetical protein